MTTATFPKSYMTDAEREEMRQRGAAVNTIYLAESRRADEAGDDEASWAWLGFAEIPAHSLLFLKHSGGAEYVRSLGLNLAPAEEAYGPGWLDDASL
ncbi:MAG: hypothetical protein LBG44_04570 [Gemmatimonadota bacterium]|jgi:hypothetical protein|nr:hypothetical protein [Gemmatimonadota bacterium]